jgi:hypothetical protein
LWNLKELIPMKKKVEDRNDKESGEWGGGDKEFG